MDKAPESKAKIYQLSLSGRLTYYKHIVSNIIYSKMFSNIFSNKFLITLMYQGVNKF